MTDSDIVAELRRKIGNRDGDDGVIGVTFGEMRSLLDAIDALRWYADEDNYDPESGAPGLWENASCESGQQPEWDFEPDEGERARAALVRRWNRIVKDEERRYGTRSLLPPSNQPPH